MAAQNTIFKLIKIEYREDKKPRYPSFEVSRAAIGYFSSLDKAEQMIEKIATGETWVEPHRLFGFLIEEYALDTFSHYCTESKRNYLPYGALWDKCLLSETPDENGDFQEFLGRPADKMQFRLGDLVEVLSGDKVTLEIVGNQPCTPEKVQEMKERSRKISPDFPGRLDYSDDSYYTLDQYGEHGHPQPVTMFPVRLKVSKKLREKLLSDEYRSYRAYYDNLEVKKEF